MFFKNNRSLWNSYGRFEFYFFFYDDWSDVNSLPHYHDYINGPKERTLRKYLHANSNAMPQLIDLIDRMLTLNPAKRITAKEALKHQYFQTRIFVMMPRIEQDGQPPKDPPIQKKVKQEQKPLLQGIKINKCM